MPYECPSIFPSSSNSSCLSAQRTCPGHYRLHADRTTFVYRCPLYDHWHDDHDRLGGSSTFRGWAALHHLRDGLRSGIAALYIWRWHGICDRGAPQPGNLEEVYGYEDRCTTQPLYRLRFWTCRLPDSRRL